ncbi:hypothetical protein AMJ57_01360 [Parcubacteria bacterium SG8_24]|nr:MAG: hypothetical protein AMJ57_01360 [Parcubacteria bacterium SG8_24]
MSATTRKIIALTFIAVFAVTAPAVVLLTSGYRFNIGKNRLERTGTLYISTEPAGAVVSIDGNIQTERTPASLVQLLPEEYFVELTRPGYLPWSKRLAVESGRTTFVKDQRLLRDVLPRSVHLADIRASAFSADGLRVALLTHTGGWLELTVLELEELRTETLARFSPQGFRSAGLSWSADDGLLLLDIRTDGDRREIRELLVYPLTDGRDGPMALHDRLPELLPGSPRWSPQDSRLVLLTQVGTFVWDATDNTMTAVTFSTRIQDALFAADRLLLIRQDEQGRPYLLETVPGELRLSATEPLPLPTGTDRLVTTAGQGVIAADSVTGSAITVDLTDGQVSDTADALGASLERGADDRLLLWNDFQIAIARNDGSDHYVVTRVSDTVSGCSWHPGGQYVLYATPKKLRAIELDGRDRRNAYTLAKFDEILDFSLDPSGELLRLIGKIGNQTGLFEREL